MQRRKNIWLLVVLLISSLVCKAQSLPSVNIWSDTDEKATVNLTPYLAEGTNRPVVIVCPGGSYFWLGKDDEGTLVAEWLQQNGISAFVLNYRAAGVPAYIFHTRWFHHGNQYPDPQNDLQQAIAYVKDHANEYSIDTTKVGAMGFSAGGHLVMSVAEKYLSPRVRPAFVAPIYPVVSFTEKCVHKRSRRGLLGEYKKNDKSLRKSLSLEKYVPDDCPPVFLMNCKDDPTVEYQNSELLDSALSAKNIPHKYIQYSTGGHGFGASESKGTSECHKWKVEFIYWIKSLYPESFTK